VKRFQERRMNRSPNGPFFDYLDAKFVYIAIFDLARFRRRCPTKRKWIEMN